MMDRLQQTITYQKDFKGPDKKDFRSTAGEFNKTDVKKRKNIGKRQSKKQVQMK